MVKLKNKTERMNLRNKVIALSAGANAAMLTMVSTAFAENPFAQFGGAMGTMLGHLESTLKGLVVPIATVALIFCFIMMLVSQNQKKVESYRGWCITILICIVAIYAIPFLISVATTIGQSFAPTTP